MIRSSNSGTLLGTRGRGRSRRARRHPLLPPPPPRLGIRRHRLPLATVQMAAAGCAGSHPPSYHPPRPTWTIDDQKARIVANTRPVRRRPAGQQRAADWCAGRKVLLVKVVLNEFSPSAAAPDRGGQGRPGRPPDILDLLGRPPGALYRLLRRPSFEAGETAQGAGNRCSTARSRRPGQCADLRHLQPPPPDAGIRNRKTWRRTVNDEIHPGETTEKGSRCPTASACGFPSPIQPGRLPGRLPALAR